MMWSLEYLQSFAIIEMTEYSWVAIEKHENVLPSYKWFRWRSYSNSKYPKNYLNIS